jgi:replicative DNA helicase
MLLAYLVKNKEDLATYTMCLDTDVFTSKAREWIFLILKKNYLYSKSLTSKEMFYIEMEQQLDARQEKYGKEISEELDIIYSIEPTDSIDLIVRKLEEAKVASQLVNVMQTTHGYLSSGNVEEAIDAYKKASMQISLAQKQKTVSGLFANADEWLQDIRNRKENP